MFIRNGETEGKDWLEPSSIHSASLLEDQEFFISCPGQFIHSMQPGEAGWVSRRGHSDFGSTVKNPSSPRKLGNSLQVPA